MPSHQCHSCGAAVTVGDVVARDGECDSCHSDLRCCRNCRHFDERYNNSCRENMADPVEDKGRRNFCEYFSFSAEPFQASSQSDRAAQARTKLEALFGGGETKPDRATDARARLDALFKKGEPGENPGGKPSIE